MKSHLKGQKSGSNFELPDVRSSVELHKMLKVKREEMEANLGQTNASIPEAPRNKPNQPPTTQPFKLSMFAANAKTNLNSNTENKPKKKVSDNASRTQSKVPIEKSTKMEVSLKKNKGLKIQASKAQSLIVESTQPNVSKIQDPKGQVFSQDRESIQIQDPKRQPMKKRMIEDGTLKKKQTMKRKIMVENESSKGKQQLQNKTISEKVTSRGGQESINNNQQKKKSKEQPVEIVVAEEDESNARQGNAGKKTKITPLYPSMLIDDFLKANGKDVEKEMQKLIEEEDVMEEQELEACETSGTSKKRTRGPTRCLKIHGRSRKDRPKVTLDDNGEPIGPDDKTVTDLSYFLGTIARNADFCPLIYTNFKQILKTDSVSALCYLT